MWVSCLPQLSFCARSRFPVPTSYSIHGPTAAEAPIQTTSPSVGNRVCRYDSGITFQLPNTLRNPSEVPYRPNKGNTQENFPRPMALSAYHSSGHYRPLPVSTLDLRSFPYGALQCCQRRPSAKRHQRRSLKNLRGCKACDQGLSGAKFFPFHPSWMHFESYAMRRLISSYTR